MSATAIASMPSCPSPTLCHYLFPKLCSCASRKVHARTHEYCEHPRKSHVAVLLCGRCVAAAVGFAAVFAAAAYAVAFASALLLPLLLPLIAAFTVLLLRLLLCVLLRVRQHLLLRFAVAFAASLLPLLLLLPILWLPSLLLQLLSRLFSADWPAALGAFGSTSAADFDSVSMYLYLLPQLLRCPTVCHFLLPNLCSCASHMMHKRIHEYCTAAASVLRLLCCGCCVAAAVLRLLCCGCCVAAALALAAFAATLAADDVVLLCCSSCLFCC